MTGKTATITVATAGTPPADAWYPYGRLLADWNADVGVDTTPLAAAPGGVAVTKWTPMANYTAEDLSLSVTSAVPPGYSLIDGHNVLRFAAASWIGTPALVNPIKAPLTVIAAVYDASASSSAVFFTGFNPAGATGFLALSQVETGTPSELRAAIAGGVSVDSTDPPRANAWGVVGATVNKDGVFVVSNAGSVTSKAAANTTGGTLNGITLGGPSTRPSSGNFVGRVKHLRLIAGEMTAEATKARIAEVRELCKL